MPSGAVHTIIAEIQTWGNRWERCLQGLIPTGEAGAAATPAELLAFSFTEQEASRAEAARQVAQKISSAKTAAERAHILSDKNAAAARKVTGQVRQIGINGISVGDRLRSLNQQTVADLARSMESLGMLNPVTVRPIAGGRYEIVCGVHRLEAARLLGVGDGAGHRH